MGIKKKKEKRKKKVLFVHITNMALALKEEDLKLMLAAKTHIGTKNSNPEMRRYIWRRSEDGSNILHLGKTWEKLMLAARIIVAIENPEDVVVISARKFGQRAVFKYAQYTGASYVGGRYTPGTFTNQLTRNFLEPRLLIITDPISDSQPILESSYCNIPVVSLCNADNELKHVDVAIPCNNIEKKSIALMYWFLAREVLRMRGTISRAEPWNIMVDLFMYRDPDDVEKAQQAQVETAAAAEATEEFVQDDKVTEWGAEEFQTTAGAAAPPVAAAVPQAAMYDNWQAGTPATTAPTTTDGTAPQMY